MDANECMVQLYDKKKIECDKTEYHRDVRNAILDFQLRHKDLGNEDTVKFCQSQIDRLDKEHGLPPV